jgi:spermidine synthase
VSFLDIFTTILSIWTSQSLRSTVDLELRQDDRFRVVQSDALKFIFQAAQKPDLYDLIIFDINGGVDGQPSPSPIFVSKDFLARLQKCLTKSGELIFHLINR